jgi:hypothetical protein
MLEQITEDDAAGRFIRVGADKLCAPIRSSHRARSELAADIERLLAVALTERLSWRA